MSRLAALSLALLLSTATAALADPPERRGHRGDGPRSEEGRSRGDGERGRGHRDDGGARPARPDSAPPVTANDPGRGQRSWSDRPREARPAPSEGTDAGRRYGLEGGPGGRGRGDGVPGADGGQRWTERGRGRDGRGDGGNGAGDSGAGDRGGRGRGSEIDRGPRDYAGSGQGPNWRGHDNDGRGRGRDGSGDNAGRGNDDRGRGGDWRGDNEGRGRGGDWRGNDGRSDDGRGRGDWRGDDGRRNGQWGDDDGRRRYAGNDDRRWRGRPGYGRQLRDRDHGRHWYEPHRYRQHFRVVIRYRAPAYIYPHGYYAHGWRFGEYLPYGWYGARYYLDWRAYDLPYPPIGCEWVRVGRDALLVDVWTGEILRVYYDLFW